MTRCLVVLSLIVCACGDDGSAPDASPPDDSLNFDANVVMLDANVDAPDPDGAVPDGAVPDAAVPDARVPDAAIPDAPIPDAPIPDANLPDAMIPMSLFACSVNNEVLYQLNPATGAEISNVTMTSAESLNNCYGMATDPTTNILYVLLGANGTGGSKQSAGRYLFTVNTSTGALTLAGNTGENLVGIAFQADGTLWGVSGNNANISDHMYKVEKTSGVLSNFQTVGPNDHHAIAFHPGGLLYHFHEGEAAAPELDTVDVAGGGISPIASTGSTTNQVGGAVWNGDDGVFLLGSSRDSALYKVTPAGVVAPLGTAPARIKGMAFAPTP